MSYVRWPYRLATHAAGLAAAAALPFSRAVRQAVLGRRETLERLARWERPGPDRPLVLFHSSSVGEARQIEPVLRRLHALHPSWPLAFTWFSPSAAGISEGWPVQFQGYLPWDTAGGIGRFLDRLKPAAIIFGKHDLWPELVLAARRRGIRLGLVAATVRPSSSRLRWPARALLHPAYQALDQVAVVSGTDGERLVQLGVRPSCITVTGDPRVDGVFERLASPPPDVPALAADPSRPALVAGSTWPKDEEVLLRAFAAMGGVGTGARLLLVPHAPRPDDVDRLGAMARRLGLPRPGVLGRTPGDAPFLIVDRVGALAWLYGSGAMAYVGGGYGRAGLHSVLEPAAWQIPITTGPAIDQSRDATLLAHVGGLVPLPKRGQAPAALAALWSGWINDPEERSRRGRAARHALESARGAADRTAALLSDYLAGGVGPTMTPS